MTSDPFPKLMLTRMLRFKAGDFVSANEITADGEFPVFGGNGLRGYSEDFNTVGPVVLVGRQGAHCGNVKLADGKIWVTEHALRCFPKKELEPRWLAYALAHLDLNQYSVSAAQPGLSIDNLNSLLVDYPSPPTQRRIAGYLDDKTARIDALIEKKWALLDRLAEKRQALITRAVTRGLNPTAPLKDSGIDWLGKVPAHWEVKPLKFVGDVLQGMTYSPDDVVDEGEGWLVVRASNIQDGRLVHADDVFVSFDATPPNICREGDIIICSRNGSRHLIGKCATVYGEWVGQTFGAFMSAVRSEFGSWLSLVLASQIFEHQSGMFMSSTINQLTNSTLKNLVVPLPPKAEQEEISAGIIPRIEQLYVAQDAVRNSIVKLTEYRAALVTAAVTVKIRALLVADHKESAAPMQAIQA